MKDRLSSSGHKGFSESGPGEDLQRRLADEARMLEEARAELRAGQGLQGEALKAWLDSFVSNEPAAEPGPKMG